jgi:hypothetical protein
LVVVVAGPLKTTSMIDFHAGLPKNDEKMNVIVAVAVRT